MTMVSCSVCDCEDTRHNYPGKYTFHRFPSNPLLREKWLSVIRRVGWTQIRTPLVSPQEPSKRENPIKTTMSRMKLFQSQKDGDDDCGPSGPCLQVSPDVQLKEQPSTGEEFLLKVILERKNIPALVEYKEYNNEESLKNQTPNMEEIFVATAPDKLKPTIEWQNIQVADFSESRMYVSRMRSHPDATIIPFEYDHCYRGWKKFFKTYEPSLSRVIGLKRKVLDDGLQTLLKFLTSVKPGDTMEHVTGQWLYTFMACIKLPILSDTHGLLRDIARQCAEIRSHIDPERDDAVRLATPLNLFICLVGRYFRQYDLAD